MDKSIDGSFIVIDHVCCTCPNCRSQHCMISRWLNAHTHRHPFHSILSSHFSEDAARTHAAHSTGEKYRWSVASCMGWDHTFAFPSFSARAAVSADACSNHAQYQHRTQRTTKQPANNHRSKPHAAQHAGRMARRARGGRGVVPAFWWRAFGKKTTWGVF